MGKILSTRSKCSSFCYQALYYLPISKVPVAMCPPIPSSEVILCINNAARFSVTCIHPSLVQSSYMTLKEIHNSRFINPDVRLYGGA